MHSTSEVTWSASTSATLRLASSRAPLDVALIGTQPLRAVHRRGETPRQSALGRGPRVPSSRNFAHPASPITDATSREAPPCRTRAEAR